MNLKKIQTGMLYCGTSVVILLLLITTAVSAQPADDTTRQQPYWNNPSVFRHNKLAPHVEVIPYSDTSAVYHGDYLHSKYLMLLNGQWEFYYVDTPAEAPDGRQVSAPDNEWVRHHAGSAIQVPGNWELQGYGVPVYVNMRNEFVADPPWAPTHYNPIGTYVRHFTLPTSWSSRQIFFYAGAVKSNCYLYINGHYVGYSEDSKTPAEFNITRYVHEGQNTLVLQVYRTCNGSYWECQDMWRLSGITRNVYLYAKPATHIKDYRVLATLDTTDYTTGLLDLTIDYNREVTRPHSIELQLFDSQRHLVTHVRKAVNVKDWFTFINPGETQVGTVRSWSPDSPALYTLVLNLYDYKDSLIEAVASRIGFRTVEQKHGQLLLNGTTLQIRGVNRHEHSGTTGQYVSRDEMRTDAIMMKQNHINAVRTSHYPDDEYWYSLCDSIGIMIWDEANVESHAQGYGEGSLAKDDAWSEAILYRCNNMYQRDKNHPSVVAWSLGNECGNGVVMERAYRFMKRKDCTRPITYERAEQDWNTDVVEVMYPSVDYLARYGRTPQRRPYVIAEYAHAMGNSLGGLADYWDTIDKYPQLQGGFIWDWVDQSFVVHDTTGRFYYAVGGDLGQLPGIVDDNAFCANGLVTSDRKPHAHLQEVKAVYGRRHAQQQGLPYTKTDTILWPDRKAPVATQHSLTPTSVAIDNIGELCIIHNNLFSLKINRHTGTIISYCYQQRERLAAPLHLNFWRPPTLNDQVDPHGLRAWQGLNQLKPEVLSLKASILHDTTRNAAAEVIMTVVLSSPDGQLIRAKLIVEATTMGIVQLSCQAIAADFHTLPKVGFQLGVDTTLRNASWMGNGYETYPDRHAARQWGQHQGYTRSWLGEVHVVPQESGNHEFTQLSLYRDSLYGLCFYACDEPLNFGIRQYEDSVITKATRINQLVPSDHYVLNIDYRQAGLGTATCGPGVRATYRLSGDSTYRFRLVISPVEISGWAPALFGIHPEMMNALPSEQHPQWITQITASRKPDELYDDGYPTVLYDGQRGVVGDYHDGWIGFHGQDTIVLTVRLDSARTLHHIELGSCHSAADWVTLPHDVQVRWSRDTTTDDDVYSHWVSLDSRSPITDRNNDSRRITYTRRLKRRETKHIRQLQIRLITTARLRVWHPYFGEENWTMIDEVSVW